MGDEAASMETDEGGAEMSRALAGAKRKGMSVGHRHHYHGRGGLSQFQGAPRPNAPFFGGGGGSGGSGMHSYQHAFPPSQQQQHVPRHRRGGGGHLPFTDVTGAEQQHAHAHQDATPGGSADGGGGSSSPLALTADPTSLQSVAPASTVTVASAASLHHHGHHHHHQQQSRYQPTFPFTTYGGHRPPALGGSGLANEGIVSPLTSPTVSADSSSGSSSSSSSASASAGGRRAHFGRQQEGRGEQEEQRQGPRMWRFEGAPLSREESTGGVFTHTSSSNGDGGPPNTQPQQHHRQQHHHHQDRGPRKRLRLTLANDQEAAWHGFVLASARSASAVPTQFAPGTEGQDAGERMLMVAAGGLEGMHVCAAEEEVAAPVPPPVVFGEGMTTGEIIALRLHQRRQREEQEASETPGELPNSSSGIERFNRDNALDRVHPAAG